RDRKQIVDGLLDPAQAHERNQAGRRLRRHQRLPPERREDDLQRVERDDQEHPPAGRAKALGDFGKTVISGEPQQEREPDREAERDRELHDATSAATRRGAPEAAPSARNALKRRATSLGATVGRPSLLMEPGAMRA